MKRIPEGEKEEFQGLLRLSQHAGTFSEEHTYWCEMAGYAVVRNGFMGIGRRFVEAGAIDRADDIFFLTPDEIDLAILVPDRFDLRYIVEPRKEARNKRTYESIVPVLTTRASVAEASALDVLPSQDAVGIKVLGFEVPPVNPELKADMYGLFGAPGVVEGTARVVARNEDLDKLVPGEIMVSAKISSSWSPIFALLGGAVTDRSGSLGHTGCLCREYGIPAVVNTVNENREFVSASAMIKTGQRIRVDGTNHTVYILDK
ncbi:MAG: Chondramide synthase cmdD [Syntrophorhabdus sp. PtaU1.Bin153]|nr:MAG: Chondramide synthase cmdD [Syntrophorhabdus sp. PtaU1.Bin153]